MVHVFEKQKLERKKKHVSHCLPSSDWLRVINVESLWTQPTADYLNYLPFYTILQLYCPFLRQTNIIHHYFPVKYLFKTTYTI